MPTDMTFTIGISLNLIKLLTLCNTVSPYIWTFKLHPFKDVSMSSHISWFTCLAHTVTCVQPLQALVLLCTSQYYRDYSSTVSLFRAQDPNVGRHTKAAAAVQNAVQCCAVACDEKQRAPIQTTLDRFLKRVDRIEPSKEPEPVPSTSGVSEAAACPHLLLLPTLQL